MTGISNEWKLVTIDQLGRVESGKPLPCRVEDSHLLFEDGFIPLVDGEAVSNSNLYIRKCKRHFNYRGLKSNKLFPKNTVCIVRVGGSVGKTALLKRESCLTEHVYFFSSYPKISDNKFIKYCLNFSNISEKIICLSKSSTAQPVLSLQKLKIIKFPCPPQEEQERIGDTLSAYDELIENNERQIEVLQGIRTAIFKEWFVNFGFPNYLTYEAERERERESSLPDSWQYQKIEEIATITKGEKSAKLSVKDGKYPFFTSSEKSPERINEYSWDAESIFINYTGNFVAQLYRGKFDASDNCWVIIPKNKKFLYLLLETIIYSLPFFSSNCFGMKVLRSNLLFGLNVLIPDIKTLEKFNNICEFIQLKIENLQKNIERLEKIKNDLFKMIFSRKISIN
ncbi:restriction endonuclease subunit S [Mycoplasma suis]|uniref:Type I restriction-modification system specificity subunit n=1 Tax=Mycoplasma suis (strain Illinois) TaxID=768700 RepID=F0QS67_MYCSL|nr:restriction endonuclease subunit S [Mycoplasma suis]ADX98337.1 type I restriction-modification system specificity subunit [Mycoplasma suis str. Illinois]